MKLKPTTKAFVAGAVAAILVALGLRVVRGTMLFPEWRRIQVLRSADGQHLATLQRLYGYMDVNFRVTLDGETIHRSRDCAPRASVPFRETLAWDATGKILVFQLAGQTVFAFETISGREIDPKEFGALELPAITLDDIGFEGRQELRGKIRETK